MLGILIFIFSFCTSQHKMVSDLALLHQNKETSIFGKHYCYSSSAVHIMYKRNYSQHPQLQLIMIKNNLLLPLFIIHSTQLGKIEPQRK